MKKKLTLFLGFALIMLTFSNVSFGQVDKILGTWKTIDDETGEAKSHVYIFKATNGYYYGRIKKLLKDPPDKLCTACKGEKKNKKILGMIILTKMKAKGDYLGDGKIMDPKNGKYYYCTIELDDENPDKLVVRGSLDSWGWAGRTQYWYRLK